MSAVDPESLGAFEELAQTDSDGWRDSSCGEKCEALFGAVYHGQPAALSNYKIDRGGGARIGVFTAPEFRGRGIGRAVASACASRATDRRPLVLWQTLESNVASVRLAESIGFARAGNHLALRLE